MSQAADTAERTRLIRLIHVGRRELGMEEDAYRAILKARTGKESARDCSVIELEKVLWHFKRAGFKVRQPKRPGASRRALSTEEFHSKVRAVWLEMHRIGAVRSPDEAALAAYVKRVAGVDDLRFLPIKDEKKVLESLKKWGARVAAQRLRGMWAELGFPPEAMAGWLTKFTLKRADDLPFDAAIAALDELSRMKAKAGGAAD